MKKEKSDKKTIDLGVHARAMEQEIKQLMEGVGALLMGKTGLILHRDYIIMSREIYEKTIVMTPPKTNRGAEWLEFYIKVVSHIDDYTVPQYGDKPNDPLHKDWSIKDCAKGIKKYCDRAGKNSRGPEEDKRDMLKIAHYACVTYFKMIEGDASRENNKV